MVLGISGRAGSDHFPNALTLDLKESWPLDKMELSECICSFLTSLRKYINNSCSNLEAWQIILFTFGTVLLAFYLKQWIENLCEDGMYRIWHFFRSLPFVKQQVEKKMKDTTDIVENELKKGMENKTFLKALPQKGRDSKNIVKEVENYLTYGKFKFEKGYVSGAVYPGNDEKLMSLMKDVYGLTSYTNPLHCDIFPGIRVMEVEIVQMVSDLFHSPRPIGVVTSGGTESIFLACKAYRDYAKYEKGIKNPNMVIPITAHAAFDKAATLLKIKVKHVKIEPGTLKISVKSMKKAIDGNTCMIVGSAPDFPHGQIDPIEEISELGYKKGIPVHVDACLGGFLIPFMEKAGFPLPKFDFRLPGVCSISVDTHKYAFAPKGSSVLLYRDKRHRHYQFSVQPDWPGGIYGTPNISGSRSGGVIATCWAALLYHGEETYVECTRKIISVTRYIEENLREMKEIYIIGKPEVSVIAIGSEVFDIYRLSGGLTEKGWNLNALQYPSGFHLCITMQHTYDGVADKFLSDVRACIAVIMKNPDVRTSGSAAIYGMAQQIPDRSLVSELVWAYLDACYNLSYPVENGVSH